MSDEDNTELLPLFPLPMMPLPGEVSALHIFEPRYREMLEHCRAQPREDGDFVIQYEEGERSAVTACAVSVTRVLREYGDGQLDILVEGRRRVEVLGKSQFHTYTSARVSGWNDVEEDWNENLATRVYALHRQLLVTVTGDEPSDSFYENRNGISFIAAASGGMDFRSRLDLLRSRSENERLAKVLVHLEEMIPLMQKAMPAMQGIAGSYALWQVRDGPDEAPGEDTLF